MGAAYDPPFDRTPNPRHATGAAASWSACSVSCRFRPLRRVGDRHTAPPVPRAARGGRSRTRLGHKNADGVRIARDQSGS